jgi:hypothetical protein
MERIPSQGITTKHMIAMKFSTEAIIALAVAIAFALLTFGAIAREQGQEAARSGQNAYIAANNLTLTHVGAGNPDILGFY